VPSPPPLIFKYSLLPYCQLSLTYCTPCPSLLLDFSPWRWSPKGLRPHPTSPNANAPGRSPLASILSSRCPESQRRRHRDDFCCPCLRHRQHRNHVQVKTSPTTNEEKLCQNWFAIPGTGPTSKMREATSTPSADNTEPRSRRDATERAAPFRHHQQTGGRHLVAPCLRFPTATASQQATNLSPFPFR